VAEIAKSARRASTEPPGLFEQSWTWNEHSIAAIRGLGRAKLMRHDLPAAQAAIQAAYRPNATTFERTQLARLAREAGQIDLTVTLCARGATKSS
jgi:hypothetical protein